MSNRERILNKIKWALENNEYMRWVYHEKREDIETVSVTTADEIASAYSEIVPCNRCEFKEECDKETDMRGSNECYGMIRKKLREDEEHE